MGWLHPLVLVSYGFQCLDAQIAKRIHNSVKSQKDHVIWNLRTPMKWQARTLFCEAPWEKFNQMNFSEFNSRRKSLTLKKRLLLTGFGKFNSKMGRLNQLNFSLPNVCCAEKHSAKKRVWATWAPGLVKFNSTSLVVKLSACDLLVASRIDVSLRWNPLFHSVSGKTRHQEVCGRCPCVGELQHRLFGRAGLWLFGMSSRFERKRLIPRRN